MNRGDLNELLSVQDFPCVSITMPAHRTAPDVRQDVIRLKNVVKQATEMVDALPDRAGAAATLANLLRVASELEAEYGTGRDGIAIFASPNVARRFELPFPVPERVLVQRSFEVHDLLVAVQRSARWLCLVLAEKPARMFHGFDDHLVEVRGYGFPLFYGLPGELAETAEGTVVSPRGRERERPHPGGHPRTPNFGFEPTTTREEYRKHFVKSIDDALGQYLRFEELPIVLVGVDRQVSFFKEATRHGSLVAGIVNGSYDTAPAHDLAALAWPIVQSKVVERQRDRAARELDAAIKQRKLVTGLPGAWKAAHEGRGAHLIVETSLQARARMGEGPGDIVLLDGGTTGPEVIEDVVDDLCEAVLRQGGDVTFVPDGALGEHGRIALTLRYALPGEGVTTAAA